jgi:acyl-CoA reductase-like NAD-dependent aldehyde dehydrogenase
MELMIRSSSGPILGVNQVECEDELYRFFNDNQYGVSAAIFTKDVDYTKNFASKVNIKISKKGPSRHDFHELTRKF